MTTLPVFRQAVPASNGWNLAKTFAQVVVMWGVLLFLVPSLVHRAELARGIGGFGSGSWRAAGAAAFALLSALGLWSGVTMALRGRGTPLPLDSARELVTTGPYAHVRNPMAVAGLGQGFAVALFLGSWAVLAYAAIGTLVWQYGARPLEEADLARRFGAPYEQYRQQVRCWMPRLQPYRPG